MLRIYHAPGTRSIRVIWLAEELEVPYEVVPVDFSAEYRASPEWRALNPVGKVPVMIDGELTLFESGAMVQYLLDRYGNGRLEPPRGTPEHALCLQWSWFAEATFARPLGEIVNHRRAFPPEAQSDAAIAEMRERSWLCVEAVEAALEGRTYLLGDTLTAADVMMGYSLLLVERLLPDAGERMPPRSRAYLDRLKARPGFQAALADG